MPRSGAAMRATDSRTQDTLYRQPVRARGDTSLSKDQHRNLCGISWRATAKGIRCCDECTGIRQRRRPVFELITNEGVQMKILVRNLSRETNENEVREMFQVYGAVQCSKLVLVCVLGLFL